MSLELGDTDPSQKHGGETQQFAPAHRVTFDRRELDRIFNLYGRKVAAGSKQPCRIIQRLIRRWEAIRRIMWR